MTLPKASRSLARVAALAICLLGIVGCTNTRDSGPSIEVPAGTFIQGWSADLQLRRGDRIAALDVVGDLLLVRTRNNVVYGLSADGGTIRWSSQVLEPGRTLGAPVLAGDRIVFPTTGELIIYDKAGRREREINVKRAIRSPLFADGDFIYVGVDIEGQGRLDRISLTERFVPIRWEMMGRGAISSRPVAFQNLIYTGSEDGNVYAVTEQRLPIWPLPGNVFATGGPVRADLVVDDAALYVASTDSKLYALDRVSGKIKWQYFAGSPLLTAPVVRGDSVYQFVPDRGVIALDRLTGQYNREPRWTIEAATVPLSADADYAYLLLQDGTILAVEGKTGKAAFKTQRTDLAAFAQSPAGNGMVYAGTRDGVILGIKPQKTGGTVGRVVSLPSKMLIGG